MKRGVGFALTGEMTKLDLTGKESILARLRKETINKINNNE